MRVVTIEKFGNWVPGSEEHPGFVYKGDAHLFRFTIQSPEHFFQSELPNLLSILGMTVASVYRLVLLGWPGVGLWQVYLYISFEGVEEKFELLRNVVDPHENLGRQDDEMQELVCGWLRSARPLAKKKLARALDQEEKYAKRTPKESRR